MVKTKRLYVILLSFSLALSAIFPVSAQAAQPSGYWPYYCAYTDAVKSGDTDDIIETGDALLNFYSGYAINKDIAGMSYNIYAYRCQNAVFEQMGDYDKAIESAEKLARYAQYLGFTDAVIGAEARAKKLDPMTEVYALSRDGESALYYGAKNEPESGTYYGRVADVASGTTVLNDEALAGEAIVSFYVEAGQSTAADYGWLIGKYDGAGHVIHIALNFPGEGATVSAINSGTCDGNIKETLLYLAGLKSPVLLRIGGEMNLWQTDAEAYKKAYIRVAEQARTYAPNAALVWSPNYVGYWGSNASDYYPGDGYVDWVGVSLYTNSETASGSTAYDDGSAYFGRGAFADCILSMREIDDLALAHNKPVIVTEGGTGMISGSGKSYEAEAAAQTAKRYAALNMVYPNIKGMIYFDCDTGGGAYRYALSNSSAVSAAYDKAVSSNPTLISEAGGTAPSYLKLSDFSGDAGSVDITAYSDTLYGSAMTVTYYLAGSKISSVTALPYPCTLNTARLDAGKYKFEAVFCDGAGYTKTKTYTLLRLQSGTVTFTEGYDSSAADTPAPWAKEEVGLAMDMNLVPADLQGKYTSDITRLDFCRLIISLIERKTGLDIGAILADRGAALDYDAFTDTVNKDVLAAKALGIVGGRGDGTFDCSAGINREEAAKMLKNAADILGIEANGGAVAFSDAASFSAWAAGAIAFVSSAADASSGKAVMGGTGGNRFSPKGAYTYQQAYITMLRLYRA